MILLFIIESECKTFFSTELCLILSDFIGQCGLFIEILYFKIIIVKWIVTSVTAIWYLKISLQLHIEYVTLLALDELLLSHSCSCSCMFVPVHHSELHAWSCLSRSDLTYTSAFLFQYCFTDFFVLQSVYWLGSFEMILITLCLSCTVVLNLIVVL